MATAIDLSWKFSCVILLLICMSAVASSLGLTLLEPPSCPQNKRHDMKINTALLTIHNDESMNKDVILYKQSKQCYKCNLIALVSVKRSCTVQIDARWPTRVELRVKSNGTILPPSPSCTEANLTKTYQEGGIYSIYIRSTSTQSNSSIVCITVLTNDPADPNIPIYAALGIFLFLIIFSQICYYVYKKGYIHRFICFWSTESMMSDLGPPNNINNLHDESPNSEQQPPPKKERLKSLDTFRGLSITIMIFVNYGGGKYWFFHHSKWNGLTVADLVFPWSLSFVLILAGMAFFLLMVFYILIDVFKVWSGAPFYYAGMNAIALYCGHEFFSGRFPVAFSVASTHASQLALNIWGTTFWVLVSVYMFYKEVFISV